MSWILACKQTLGEPMQHCKKMRFRKRAFSLVEMIVAMTILAVVGMLIAGSVTAFQKTYEQGRKIASNLERKQSVERFADTYFRNIIPFMWPDENASDDSRTERYCFDGQSDELWAVARTRVQGGEGDSALIFFRLYRTDENELACDYSERPFLFWEEREKQHYQTEIIAGQVAEISFLYADYVSDSEMDWLESWDEEEEEAVPLAVQLSVEWQNGGVSHYLRRLCGVSAFTELNDGE